MTEPTRGEVLAEILDDIRTAAARLRETSAPDRPERAVADLLDGIAGRHEPVTDAGERWCDRDDWSWPCDDVRAAYAVARALLDLDQATSTLPAAPDVDALRDLVADALIAHDYPAADWPDGPPGEGERDTASSQADAALAVMRPYLTIPAGGDRP